jgi:uncharacterized protein (DUF736 family)
MTQEEAEDFIKILDSDPEFQEWLDATLVRVQLDIDEMMSSLEIKENI